MSIERRSRVSLVRHRTAAVAKLRENPDGYASPLWDSLGFAYTAFIGDLRTARKAVSREKVPALKGTPSAATVKPCEIMRNGLGERLFTESGFIFC